MPIFFLFMSKNVTVPDGEKATRVQSTLSSSLHFENPTSHVILMCLEILGCVHLMSTNFDGRPEDKRMS